MLATLTYDDRGRRTSLTRRNGTVASYGYDAVSRLTSLTENLSGTGHYLTLRFSHNPVGGIASNTRSNDTYAWTNHYALNRTYSANGLNRYTAITGSTTPTYDGRGNLTAAGGDCRNRRIGRIMNCQKPLLAALLLVLPGTAAVAQPGAGNRRGVPVFSETPNLNSCNISVVRGLRRGAHLSVRSGPAGNYPRLGRLSGAELIYVCNEHLEWWGIVYSGPDGGCRAIMPRPSTSRYSSSCRSGWVHRDWVELLTG